MNKKELRQKVKQLMTGKVLEATLYQDKDWCHVRLEHYQDGLRYTAHGFSKRNMTDKPNRELGYNLARVRAYRQLARMVPEYTQLQLPEPIVHRNDSSANVIIGSAYEKRNHAKLIIWS